MDPRLVVLGGMVSVALVVTPVPADDSATEQSAPQQATPTSPSGTPEPLPDLVVAGARSDRTWDRRWSGRGCPRNWDEMYSVVDVQIANRGEAPAGHFLVRGEESGQTPVIWDASSFAAGEARWLGEQRGAARIVVVDPDDEVRESDESNNLITRAPTFAMTPPPLCSSTPSPTGAPYALYLSFGERRRLR